MHVSVCLSALPGIYKKTQHNTNTTTKASKQKTPTTAERASLHCCDPAASVLGRRTATAEAAAAAVTDTHILMCDLEASQGRRCRGGEGGSGQIALKLWPKSAYQSV